MPKPGTLAGIKYSELVIWISSEKCLSHVWKLCKGIYCHLPSCVNRTKGALSQRRLVVHQQSGQVSTSSDVLHFVGNFITNQRSTYVVVLRIYIKVTSSKHEAPCMWQRVGLVANFLIIAAKSASHRAEFCLKWPRFWVLAFFFYMIVSCLTYS